MTAPLVVLEGIDGSGKGTQTRLLAERLQATGRRVETLTFPQYETNRFGALITRFLAGEFGPLDAVPPELAALLFAGDRYESAAKIAAVRSRCDVVACDRYAGSNMAHQGSRVSGQRRTKLLELLDWLEFDLYDLPRPLLTVWLSVTPDVASANIHRRAATSSRDIDIAEDDLTHLREAAAVYGTLATQDDWAAITCDDGQTMRSIEVIAEEVFAVVDRGLSRGE